MKRKQFLACMMMVAMAATVAVPSFTAKAEGLTQAASAEEVNYGSLTESDKEILKSMFDVDYYKEQNPELVEVLGDDYNKLFSHFCLCGIFEGRTCNPNFDPAAYASAYTDLKDAYGTDIMKYYEHYAVVGSKENRTLTTIAACADAGITVEGLVGENVKISPAVYKLSLTLGTTNFKAVQNLVNGTAAATHKSSGGSGAYSVLDIEDHQVIITPVGDEEAFAKADSLEKIGTIALNENEGNSYFNIYIVKGETGYAAYKDTPYISSNTNLVYSTEHYVSKGTITVDDVVAELTIIESHYETDYEEYAVINEFDYTGTEYHEDTTVTTAYDVNKNIFHVQKYNGDVIKNNMEDSVIDATATDYCDWSWELAGYYTDYDGTEIHRFESEEERKEYIINKHSYATEENYKEYESGHTFYAYDVDADRSTTYDVGIEITENADGSANVTVGVSNAENEFGYTETITVGADEAEETEEGQE